MLSKYMRAVEVVFVIVLSGVSVSYAQSGTWTIQDSLEVRWGAVSYKAVDACDTTHCMAVGLASNVLSVVRQTTDGGKTWRSVFGDSLNFLLLRDIAHPVPGLAIVVGDKGLILRTADGGETWSKVACDATFDDGKIMNLHRVAMFDSLHGIIGGFSKMLLRTDDGGYSWKRVGIPTDSNYSDYGFTDVVCLSPNTYLILMGRLFEPHAVFRTEDGGESWTSSFIDTVYNLHFVDSLRGWGAGPGLTGPGSRAEDIITRTTNGGRSWETILKKRIEPDLGLRYVEFADAENGMAVGAAGKVLHTTNGGVEWVRGVDLDSLFGVFNLMSVAYPRAGWAWAVDVVGQILHYSEQKSSVNAGPAAGAAGRLSISPNPISSFGDVRFHIGRRSHVRLSVSDMLGREMRLVLDDFVEVGTHAVPVEGSGLPAGMYILRLENEGALLQQRLIIVR